MTSARVISIAFTVVTGIYMLYQIALGNPFQDEVHPVIPLTVCFLMGILGIVVSFRRKS